MRTLTMNEIDSISGGEGELLFGLFVIGMAATALYYGSQPSRSCKTYYEQVVTYYDVTTPVYDAYGIYQGDKIDTYPDTKYVPVTVCI